MTIRLPLAVAALVVAACNSPLAPTSAATFTITANGVSPKEVQIKAWNHVTFINNDTRTLTITRGCGFHDHLNRDDDTMRGRIVVE